MKKSSLIIIHKILLCFTLTMICAANAQIPTKNRILILGDSISAGYGLPNGTGWVNLLQTELSRKYPNTIVQNASLSGDTTSGGKRRLPDLLKRFSPTVFVLELGANDALRGFPLEMTKQNLMDMVRMAHSEKSQVLILGMRVPSNYGPEYTRAFFNIFGEVAKSTNSPLVPFLLESMATNGNLFQEDGIHPNIEAQPILLKNVLPSLERLLH
jgi:acyl-CoA thioesterase-1